jgi:hypothetical protein
LERLSINSVTSAITASIVVGDSLRLPVRLLARSEQPWVRRTSNEGAGDLVVDALGALGLEDAGSGRRSPARRHNRGLPGLGVRAKKVCASAFAVACSSLARTGHCLIQVLLVASVAHFVDKASIHPLKIHAYPLGRVCLVPSCHLASNYCRNLFACEGNLRDRLSGWPISHILHLMIKTTDCHVVMRVTFLHRKLLNY